jgi:hypothetical protein
VNRAESERTALSDDELEAERVRLAERERFLAAREAALVKREQAGERGATGAAPAQAIPIDVVARARALEEQEREVLLREARLEADHEIREQRLETREAEAAEREEKLQRREDDLGDYVGQVQSDFDRRDRDWWSKQLGEPVKAAS